MRTAQGWRPCSWEDAWQRIEAGLLPILAEHGRHAVAVYLGNPTVHNVALSLYARVFLRALGTHNVFSASTVDQMPKQVAAGLMFGTYTSIPVPDIERTDLLVLLGANPFVSNGSLWTVPDFPGRLRRLHARGGRSVVVDPCRTRTAAAASEHIPLRPGSDAWFLFALVHVLFEENLVRLGRLAPFVAGLDELERAARSFAPERVAERCGIEAARIRELARELATTPRAAVYGRIGTCTQRFGTLASYLVDVCNVLTGHLDEPGGAMFPKAAAFAANTSGEPGRGRGVRLGRRKTRVRGAPEVAGEFPVACLAEEIETPGEGQIRALITIAGNPVLSTPNGARLARALQRLDFMLSLDLYRNETTRFADVILPGLSPFETSHFDIAFPWFAYRNAVRYSPRLFAPPPGAGEEWRTLLRLAALVSGQGREADLDALDDFVALQAIHTAVADPFSPVHGRDPQTLLAALEPGRGPERLIDFALRVGPYGDAFGERPEGLSLRRLQEHPHGIDLGPLAPRIPEVLRTPSGKIELAPPEILADVPRLEEALHAEPTPRFVLVGRRHLRSNNSWMHNLPKLTAGSLRCTLQIHPEDARSLGLADGSVAQVRSKNGAVLRTIVEYNDGLRRGVVSLPHGWGHDGEGLALHVASTRPGVNANLLASEDELEPLSGTAVLNGIEVEIRPAANA
jgi:anaerobic selenocysteine-containing dehydrogenase